MQNKEPSMTALFVTEVTDSVPMQQEHCITKKQVMQLLDQLKTGWTFLKFLRVGMGILILYSSIQTGQVMGMVAGGLFTLLSLFSSGVCCTSGCSYTAQKSKTMTEKIEYEELDTNK